MIKQKNEFGKYLKNTFMRYGKNDNTRSRTTKNILKGICNILEILGMTEVEFYRMNNSELLDYYRLFKIEIAEYKLSEGAKVNLLYYFRNYLEFVGINPDPIQRKHSGNPKFKIPGYHLNGYSLEARKSIKGFYDFVRRKLHPEKSEIRIDKLLCNYRTGIKSFSEFIQISTDVFYTLNIDELIKLYTDFRADENALNEKLKKRSQFSTICNGVNRYIQYLEDSNQVNLNEQVVVNPTNEFVDSVNNVKEKIEVIPIEKKRGVKVDSEECHVLNQRTIRILIEGKEGQTDIKITL